MACKSNDCVVTEYVVDPPPPPSPGATQPSAVSGIKTRNLAGGTPVDMAGASGAEDALIQQLSRDMKKAQAEQCPEGCICIKQENGKPSDPKTFDVPVQVRFTKAGSSEVVQASGTVRIKVTEYPGKCFKDYGLVAFSKTYNSLLAAYRATGELLTDLSDSSVTSEEGLS